MHRFAIFIIIFFSIHFVAIAQSSTLDSLKKVLATLPKEDTLRAETLALMSLGYMNYKPDSALVLAQQAQKMSEKLNFKRGVARSFIYQGIYYNNKADYDKSLDFLLKGIRISEEINFTKGLGDANLSIGFVYQRLNQNEKALEYYKAAIPLYEKLKDKVNIGRTQNNIGIIAKRLKKYDEALKAYQQSLETKRQIGDIRSTASTLNNIGEILQIKGDTLKAFEHYKESLEISQKFKNDQVSSIALINLAELSLAQNKNNNALSYALEAQRIAKINKFKAEEIDAGYIVAEAYLRLKDFENSLETYKKINALEDSLFNIDKAKAISNLQSTLELEKKQKEVELLDRDRKIKAIETARKQQMIELLEKDNSFQKSEAARMLLDKLVLEKENKLKEEEILMQQSKLALEKSESDKAKALLKIQEEELARKNLFIRSVIFGSVLMALFVAVLLYSIYLRSKSNRLLQVKNNELAGKNAEINQQKEEILAQSENLKQINEELNSTLLIVNEQKNLIEAKNKDITDSIIYAKRIQTAMLPFEERINASLQEYFVLFKPKDIVSGDFYWFQDMGIHSFSLESSSEQKNSNKVVVAAADCTGHGVPGAFMSMIGNELLNQIVNIRNITKPSEILAKLHKGIRNALRQETSDSRDGMDIVICTIDKETKILEFAGAKNPLFYVQNGVLYEIKGDKMPIGGEQIEEERIFTNHQVDLSTPTTIYLCSDGYQDQFGGENNKKFFVRNFKLLLENIHKEPIDKQKEILEKTLEDWQGVEKQTDDILIFGIKLEL